MLKFLSLTLLIALTFSPACYASINAVSLVDVQGESDTGLLIGAADDQKAQFFPNGKMNSQILAFYVNGVLYDAGLRDGHIAAQLEKNNVKPADVKTILMTHLHPDHFGGLLTPEGEKQYPNAEVFVSKPELAYWVDELKNENVINSLKPYKYNTFYFGDEVVPGVRAIDTIGHTPGHTAFLIEDGGEKLLIVGDIMHFPEIQLPAPDVAVRYDVDPEKAIQSRKFILDYAAMKNIPIAGMHITPPGFLNVKKNGEGYEKY
ncbi:MAG: MBL fold metallo-hydrolase [Synergistaceae bacterium]|nr:MBL fold metallo-hydrolase [Synergistaceae bacterium]